jgi:hypothetical protein
MSFNNHSIPAGDQATVNALLNGPANSGLSFGLSSTSTRLVAPATVGLMGNATVQSFNLATTHGGTTSANLTVSLASVSLTDTLKLKVN